MNYNFQQTAQEKGLDLHSQCNDKEEGTSEQDFHLDFYFIHADAKNLTQQELQHSSEQQQEEVRIQCMNKIKCQQFKKCQITAIPYNFSYLHSFYQKTRYHFNQNNPGTQLNITKQQQIIKYYPGFIFSLILFYDNSYQMNNELNQFLEQKDKNWQQICDFNQPISEKTCEKLQEQYQNIKQINQTLQKLKEQEKSRKSTEPKKPRKSKDPIDQKEPKQSKEPKDSMKLKAYRKDFKDLCKKKGIATKIQRFERFEEVRKKFDDIENQFKEKNIKDTQLLQHLKALKQFITITQRLKAEHLKNNKKYIKKTIDIYKQDILKLMENPLIKEKQQYVLNIVHQNVIFNEENYQIEDKCEEQWINFYIKLNKLFKIDLSQKYIQDLKAKTLKKAQKKEEKNKKIIDSSVENYNEDEKCLVFSIQDKEDDIDSFVDQCLGRPSKKVKL